jgi:hypothetical protein
MLRQLARQIITHEHRTERTPHEVAASAVRVYTRLLTCLSAIVGEAGGIGLFRRSLRLTEATFPFYSAVRDATSDTLLSAVGRCLQAQHAEMAFEASVELLAIYIEMLTTFIGQRLTEQLLRETWPDLHTSVSEESQA